MVKADDISEITVRLNAILRLILDFQRKSEDLKIGDQILLLEDAGLSRTSAGRILGVESNQIPSYLRGAENIKLRDKLAKKRTGSQ